MSEGSKMGLFGSKNKDNNTKKEGNKVDSPDCYAPYSIDSDSETYDTEALSIMDINDIIGVQSDPVNDSTLESEIAALSQIITETKPEMNQTTSSGVTVYDESTNSGFSCDKPNVSSSSKGSDEYVGEQASSSFKIKDKSITSEIDKTSDSITCSNTTKKAINDISENIGSTNKSLLLIGEAYTSESEDSQGSVENDNETLEINDQVNSEILPVEKPIESHVTTESNSMEPTKDISVVTCLFIEPKNDQSEDTETEAKIINMNDQSNREISEQISIESIVGSDCREKTSFSETLKESVTVHECEKLADKADKPENEKNEENLAYEVTTESENNEVLLKHEELVYSSERTDENFTSQEIDNHEKINEHDSNIEKLESTDNMTEQINYEQSDIVYNDASLCEKENIVSIENKNVEEIQMEKFKLVENVNECVENIIVATDHINMDNADANVKCVEPENSKQFGTDEINLSESNDSANKSVDTQMEISNNNLLVDQINKCSKDETFEKMDVTEISETGINININETNLNDEITPSIEHVNEKGFVTDLSNLEVPSEAVIQDIVENKRIEEPVTVISEEDTDQMGIVIESELGNRKTEEVKQDTSEDQVPNLFTNEFTPSIGTYNSNKLSLNNDSENTNESEIVLKSTSTTLLESQTESITPEQVENLDSVSDLKVEQLESLSHNSGMDSIKQSDNIQVYSTNATISLDNSVNVAEKTNPATIILDTNFDKTLSVIDDICSNKNDIQMGKIEPVQEMLNENDELAKHENKESKLIMNSTLDDTNDNVELENINITTNNMEEKKQENSTTHVISELSRISDEKTINILQEESEYSMETNIQGKILVKNERDEDDMRSTNAEEDEQILKKTELTSNITTVAVVYSEKSDEIRKEVEIDKVENEIDNINLLIANDSSNGNSELISDTIEPVESSKSEQAKFNEIISSQDTESTKSEKCDLNAESDEFIADHKREITESMNIEENEEKSVSAVEDECDEINHEENINENVSDLNPIESSEISSDMTELESAVKFLQESEEQALDSLSLSSKTIEPSNEASTDIFISDDCEKVSEEVTESDKTFSDSISIAEAEIISEAAKLENELKLAEQNKVTSSLDAIQQLNIKIDVMDSEKNMPAAGIAINNSQVSSKPTTTPNQNVNLYLGSSTITERLTKISESKASILEERLKEPPKIEIPGLEVSKSNETPITPKSSLLIQRDSKNFTFQKMLDSPKTYDHSESKMMDAPRKDSEKHDCESVGSPRIILKIVKSAIADCGEPRSPKSPKIRSATNSPNPDDSPSQKLGKIKLKLSKSGHPSIISNENIDETLQWHSEPTASLSPLGMKIKFSKSGDASIVSSDSTEDVKQKVDETRRTESPIGMKIKLLKGGDASIVQHESKEQGTKHKEKIDILQGSPKRTDSPIGMKIKLSKSGDATIIQSDKHDITDESKLNVPKRMDSPIGMKIKLSKTGDASIVSTDIPEDTKDSPMPETPKRTESPIGMKIKLSKTKSNVSRTIIDSSGEGVKDKLEICDSPRRTESPLGVKIKLSKSGDASIIHSDIAEESKDFKYKDSTHDSISYSPGIKIKMAKHKDTTSTNLQEDLEDHDGDSQRIESPIGMKIKLTKSGNASIVSSEKSIEEHETKSSQDIQKRTESPIGMKIKLSKFGDASIVQDPSITESMMKRKDPDSSIEMKIKLSKVGHPTIISSDTSSSDTTFKSEELPESNYNLMYASAGHEDSRHSAVIHGNRSEITIEPVQSQNKIVSDVLESSSKRKDITISPIEIKKPKLEAQLSLLPELSIQPVVPSDKKQLIFDPKSSSISRQQMSVLNQEISITQVRSLNPSENTMGEKLKDMLSKCSTSSSSKTDCELIENRPELIIVNENSNSSQDVMIIEEVPAVKNIDVKVPKRRGRPRRNPVAVMVHQVPVASVSKDPLGLDKPTQMTQVQRSENERPKRTCRSQKSYAPPKRGRGRGRGKRKLEATDLDLGKKSRIDQDLTAIEASITAVNPIEDSTSNDQKSSELYKALKQVNAGRKNLLSKTEKQSLIYHRRDTVKNIDLDQSVISQLNPFESTSTIQGMHPSMAVLNTTCPIANMNIIERQTGHNLSEKREVRNSGECKITIKVHDGKSITSDSNISIPAEHANWLTPVSKKQFESTVRNENVSLIQVIDEDTRMSAESGSRSQTPARNFAVPASETTVNEESQGSVLSTATTESEKVKVKNRRMEINFDPDEGPFTVDKIAEYEWPPERKGETFMIQEQISQYLGVKSFKRKYPDLKRRMVDMEERNYLRDNQLVSESMCDMGLTAVYSSEVLDVMCSDFPEQYEEYRKHMREKQVKEHSKRQKELTAAANAEKNRIDLAEMAVQSALSWNTNLNRDRKETRKCSLDLQTFTIHVPKKQQKISTENKGNHYPVALIPGQYTDYYREYTPAELRYCPLNTVLYGPMRPNLCKFDSQSEGSQSDSDSDSSSDDSSSSSSEGTQDTEESQSTMDDVDMELSNSKGDLKGKCKMCLKYMNKHGKNEILIQCGTCNGNVHPSCIDLTLDMVSHIQSYAWQCTDCKTCAQCHDPADEANMLFCDMCDRGYHIYCVGLRRVPNVDKWHCQECVASKI